MKDYYLVNPNDLLHYGTKRHSGRYPYGSGERPYQGEEKKLNKLNKLNKKSSKNLRKYYNFKEQYDLSDKSAKQAMTPMQYARWYSSGARQSQRLKLYYLKKNKNRTIKQINSILSELKDKELRYNISTGMYYIV